MSATNKTLNYELPIFIDTDKPSWLGDWNGAMTKIDNSIKTIDGVAESGVTMANEALTTAEGATTTANNALTASGEAKTEATAAKTLANNAYTLAGDAQVNSNIAIADSAKNKVDIQTVDDKLSVTWKSLTKVTGSKYNSDTFISKFISKIIYVFDTDNFSAMAHEVVGGDHCKVPFSKVAGNIFNLETESPGSINKSVSLQYSMANTRNASTSAYIFTFLSTVIWFDGVNTNLGLWIDKASFDAIDKLQCYGSTIYLPSGNFISPVNMLFSVQ